MTARRTLYRQLAAEPAPGAIDVTLTERGRVVTFSCSLPVDGNAPLELKLVRGELAAIAVIPFLRQAAKVA